MQRSSAQPTHTRSNTPFRAAGSMNATHMSDNLAVFSSGLVLTGAEMAALSSRPLDYCSADNSFYECVPSGGFAPGPHPWARRHA